MTDREHFNYHLGDAVYNIEKALSANQGQRENLLREAMDSIDFVLKEEEKREW